MSNFDQTLIGQWPQTLTRLVGYVDTKASPLNGGGDVNVKR
jgi:hypothetical protein